jgi:hypothetical protein
MFWNKFKVVGLMVGGGRGGRVRVGFDQDLLGRQVHHQEAVVVGIDRFSTHTL